MTPAAHPLLRRALLEVSVLDGVDLLPADDAVVLEVPGGEPVRLPLEAAAAVLGPWSPGSPQARVRLAGWLRTHRAVAAAPDPAALVRERARSLALPVGSALHPGTGGWARTRVLGGALEVGLGVLGLARADGGDPLGGVPTPLWPDVAAAAGLRPADVDALAERAAAHAVRMGALAAARLRRDARTAAVLRPVGGVDVLTLLATWPLRREVASSDGTGMRLLSVPDRTRGWFDERRVDRDFVAAAWSATGVEHRAVAAPLLVTADEVVLAEGLSRRR